MTVDTPGYLAEYESGLLTITRRTDGYCIAFRGRRCAGEFQDCVRSHGANRAIDCFIKIAGGTNANWKPLYNPSEIPDYSQRSCKETT